MIPGPINVAEHFIKNVPTSKIISNMSRVPNNMNNPKNDLVKYIVWGSVASGIVYLGFYYYYKNKLYSQVKENQSAIYKQIREYGIKH